MTRRTKRATAAHLEALRADYRTRVEDVAEALRPQFEAGELRGFTDADSAAIEAADRAWRAAHPRARGRNFVRASRALERCPSEQLDKAVERSFRLWDPIAQALVIVCSPSRGRVMQSLAGQTAWMQALQAARRDVLRVARSRRWYTPAPDEEPSNADLDCAEAA